MGNKGYKAFDKDLKCGGLQYKIGETYTHEGEISLCRSGFHFSLKISDCFNYYSFSPNTRICQIEYLGNILHGKDKSVTNQIRIIKEIKWEEILTLVNSGNWNSGYLNTITPKITIFNKETSIKKEDIYFPSFFYFNLVVFIGEEEMTSIEKEDNPNYKTTGGYLKSFSYKEAWKSSWDKASNEDKRKVLNLPNWNNSIFKEITGIDVEEELGIKGTNDDKN